ncbi:MAG: hypothetical protein R3C69_07365 [Geminicoccaceae bacterium]
MLRFKASFGAGRARFRTVRAVLDPDRYAELTRARAASLGVAVQGPGADRLLSCLPGWPGRSRQHGAPAG